MSDVNIQLVREFFELNGFRVMTYWQHDHVKAHTVDHGLQLFVENTTAAPSRQADFVLKSGDMASISRAIVEVRAWHADRLYASLIESNPVLFQVANEESQARARHVFDCDTFDVILAISELPASPEPRQRAVQLLQQSRIDHVIEFPMILQDLLEKISPNVSYAPSTTLQTLRLLKRYDFIRYQQLEFPFLVDLPAPAITPHVTMDVEGESETGYLPETE